ncbi:hypothetical protein Q9251_03040 [Alkalihalobacillus macyae]|uniref:hypothetical protein n=1 Tax=Guptibacillus hwajinpoensis TaxID=208199 RepID=UPI00273A8E41|nr:hypothetical protein [Alkalihalobacillus macyae]MDP4549851.1 hypothetical protein [Alkalihalobacillus macyae]
MRSIGIRVEPKQIHYCILNKNEKNDLDFIVETLKFPIALDNDIPRKLSFIRTTIFSIICEYDLHYAGLRTAEGNAQTSNAFRNNVEGVIQELFSDSTIIDYFAGTLTSMAARLNKTNTELKDCVKGKDNTFNIDKWGDLNDRKRESVLAALAAINYTLKDEGVKND